MKIKQMASVLNDVFFPEAVGTEGGETFNDDLSNVATLGTKVFADTAIGDNLNKALKSIYDKVGETIYRDESYTSGGFDIVGTDAEYGSILEKIRTEAPDFDMNNEWTFEENGGSTFEEMFGYHALDVEAKYFNTMSTFSTKPYTITEQQFRSAFTSRESVIRFISAIESRVRSKRELAINILSHKAVVGLMAEKIKSGKNVYKLLNEYRAVTGDTTVNHSNWRTSKPFLIFLSTFVNTIYDIMAEPTKLYNDDEYISQTTDEQRRFYLLSDVSRALESYVYRDSFNKDEGKIKNYKSIAYWQTVGNKGTYEERSAIRAIPISEGVKPIGADTRKAINATGVLGVIFSKYGVMVNAKELRTGAVKNEFDNWINYKHSFNAGYYVDTGENCVVFVLGDDPDTEKITVETAPETNTYWGTTVSTMQSEIIVDGFDIKGTVHYLENGITEHGTLSGSGYFIALKFSGFTDEVVTVGVSPSEGSGFIPLDEDKDGVFKITNIYQQKIIVRIYGSNGMREYTYNLDKLTTD